MAVRTVASFTRALVVPVAAASFAIAGVAHAADPPTSQPDRESGAQDTPDSILVVPKSSANQSDQTRAVNEELAFVDPTQDGFSTELLDKGGKKVLYKIGYLLQKGVVVPELVEGLHETFSCTALRPELEQTFDGDGIVVREGGEAAGRHEGLDGLRAAVAELAAPIEGIPVETVHFKMDRIKIRPGTTIADTRVKFHMMARGDAGIMEQNAHWQVAFDIGAGLEHPTLVSIRVTDHSEIRATHAIYSECTEAVFRNDPAVLGRIRRGVESWWGGMDTAMGFSLYGDYGVALGDIDNDGLDDLYICQPGSVANQMFRHLPDGTLTDVSDASGTDFLDDTPSALFIDADNDGNQDLVVATVMFIMVMRGDGTGNFTFGGRIFVDNTTSMSTSDYDGDGLLDLYICRYSSIGRASVTGESLYDSNEGRPNVLLRNEGGFSFRDVTVESGIDHNNRKFSFASVWEDFDNDGDLDLYVANDFGRNNLYRNDGGRFRDVADDVGAEDMAAGMGVTWGDYDRDGDMDIYVSNMYSSAGGRIVDKPSMRKMAGDEAISPLMRFAKGNTLLRNNGDGSFTDVSDGAGVMMGRWAWGGEFADVNNDGMSDIVVPNGFVTNHKTDDL